MGRSWGIGRAAALALLPLLGPGGCAEDDAGPTRPAATTEGAVERSTLRGTIVYSSDTAAAQDVFRLDLPDGTPVRLTHDPASEIDPALAPDGRTIAYRRNTSPDRDDADIWVMDADGTGQRNLTRMPDTANWSPAWLPDGRIVFASSRGNDEHMLELWSMAADGTDPRRVAPGWCEYPSPSPDGSRVVCSAASGGTYDLVIVSMTGERRVLTSTPETEFGASWSPDGAWIAFSRDVDEHWRLMAIGPDGSGERTIAAEGVFPTWGPDGRIAYSGPGGIDVVNPDGSGGIALDHPAQFVSWGR